VDGLAAGTVIAGRYSLERLLGEGGMGAVWAAKHLVTGKPVALKFLKATASENPDLVRRFIREARAASAVQHPNVVAIHDVITLDDGSPVMVMDLLNGESLGDKLVRERALALGELVTIMVPVLSAIAAAHALGIVHRDLKPDNIFLARYADGRVESKVLDFGIAKLSSPERNNAESAALTRTGSMMGTPYYMAPEQAFGEKDLDRKADVWALGVILYECLTGGRPFDGDNFGQLLKSIINGTFVPLEQRVTGLPPDVVGLVGRMLTVDRSSRLSGVEEAARVLILHKDLGANVTWNSVAAVTGAGVRVETSPALSVTSPEGSRSRRGLYAAATAASLAAATAVVGSWFASRHAEAVSPPVAPSMDAERQAGHTRPTEPAAGASLAPSPVISPATPTVVPTMEAPAPSASADPPKVALRPSRKKNEPLTRAVPSAEPAQHGATGGNLPGGVVGTNPFH
jgi:serine/threonine protein kinase